jgi:sec-independent protein translocase protein TatC
MTIGEHLDELRQRLIRCMLAVAVGFGLAFWRIKEVVSFLRWPLERAEAQAAAAGNEIVLMQHKAYSGFLGSMKIALFGGIVLASPVILYQLWAFVGAGLYRHERKTIKYYAVPGFFLFFAGAGLAYFYVLPWALIFLTGWATEMLEIKSYLEFSDFVSLIAFALFVFGLVFQLPVIMVFLMRLGVVEAATFRKYRRHAILASFALAMILTPPDVISQVALAVCMTILYEAAILIGGRIGRPRETGG